MVIIMDLSEILEGLSYNEKRLLLALDARGGEACVSDLVSEGAFSLETEVMGAASWLDSKGLAMLKDWSETFYVLPSPVGELPERTAVKAISAAGGRMSMEALAEAVIHKSHLTANP